MPAIRVAAADRCPLFLTSLARTIRQDSGLQLVAQASCRSELLAALTTARPHVALVGDRLPDLDAAAVVRAAPSTRVVVLAAVMRDDAAYRAIAAGASGFLAEDATPERLRRAIRAVAAGETVLCRRAQTGVARAIRLRDGAAGPLLTRRELEVLELTADGLSSRQIAGRLHVAPATVKSHVLTAYAKLGVRERAHAVAEAMRRGLLA